MEDRGPQIMAVCILFFISSWLVVALRVFVRTQMIKAFGKDDIAMLVTLLLYTGYLICQLTGVRHGTGQKRAALTDHNAQIALEAWFFCELFYTGSTAMLKIAIGLFLLRITISPLHVWIIRVIMICSGVMGTAYALIVLFQCHPVSFWWDLESNISTDQKCLSADVMSDTTYAVSALNALADWVFAILPVFIVKDLQMKTSVKVAVSAVLGFAALGSTATICRIPYLWTLKSYKGEFLYDTSDVAIWTTVEVGVGIIAGCFATLKPLMKQFFILIGLNSTDDPESGLPFSSHKRPYPSRKGFNIQDQPLDVLRPANDAGLTTTTVRASKAPGLSSWADHGRTGSDEEIFSDSRMGGGHFLDTKGFGGGISKSVEFTTITEERDSSHAGGSIGESDEERSLPNVPAVVYERL